MGQKLVIISELFFPEETSTAYILSEIANAFSLKYDVHVICGSDIYGKRKPLTSNSNFTLDRSIKLHRVNRTNLDKDKLLSRFFRFILISTRLYNMAKRLIKTGDKVLLVTNPVPLVVLIAKLKKKIGFEFILLVHDVFPENTKPAGLGIPTLLYSSLKKIFDKAYSEADLLIALGRDMKEVLNNKTKHYSKNNNIIVIENWADLDNIKMLDRNDIKLQLPTNKIIIEYAGNIGRSQGLENILNIIKGIKKKDIEFSFWGSGAIEKKLKLFVSKNKITNVKFNGVYLRSEQNKILNTCDLALVTLAEGMYGLGVPSKTYNILASGRPILFIGDIESEIAMLIKKNFIGYCYDPSDIVGISDFFENLTFENLYMLREKGLNARLLAERVYSKSIILKKFTDNI